MDYNATPANFHGRFFKNANVIDEEVYEEMKTQHVLNQNLKIKTKNKGYRKEFDIPNIIQKLNKEHHIKRKELAVMFKTGLRTIATYIEKAKEGA